MSLILVQPHNFTVLSSQSAATAPASNLNVDYPNMVWKSTSTTDAFIEIRLDPSASWDFIGLVGANLVATDTVRIRSAGNQANLTASPSYDMMFNVLGTLNSDFNLAYHLPSSAKSHRFIRLDFSAANNPNGSLQAKRLVIGRRLDGDGVDVGADFNIEDTSRISDYRGIQISDPFDAKDSWKFSVGYVKKDDYNTKWRSFIKSALGKAVLFIPDTLNNSHNQEAVFGRLQGPTNAGLITGDAYKVNLYIREV